MREKLIKLLLAIPFAAAFSMNGSCAAGCPYGLSNDPYPGQCPRYIDVNGDGFCDLSQTVTTTSDSSVNSPEDDKIPSDSVDDSNGGGYHVTDTGDSQNAGSLDDNSFADTGDIDGSIASDGGGYYLLPVSIILISGYLFTHFLFKKGILSRKKHRRFWNLFVTVGYVGTGITGIILTTIINLGIRTVLNRPFTFWHAEFAIFMVIGTLIHVHLYWKPFKKIFKVLFNFKK
ncbi:MAG: hypothetical protein Kow0019_10820 [Methanobacteriaceae archaeon]